MERPILSARDAAGYLEALDNVLLLTHVRPDGDTIGSAAALCRALRDCGQTAYRRALMGPGRLAGGAHRQRGHCRREPAAGERPVLP